MRETRGPLFASNKSAKGSPNESQSPATRPVKDRRIDLSCGVGVSKPEIADAFHGTGIGQVRGIRHDLRMVLQESSFGQKG
jgi:hypothetical protein